MIDKFLQVCDSFITFTLVKRMGKIEDQKDKKKNSRRVIQRRK